MNSPVAVSQKVNLSCKELANLVLTTRKRIIPKSLWFRSARLAIRELLRSLEYRNGRAEILIPSYHCRSIYRACAKSGVIVNTYRTDAQLRPDIEDIVDKLSDGTAAIVIIHYFGFYNNFDELVEICRKKNIRIVEDAAHVPDLDRHVGESDTTRSDWVVYCPRKHYPLYDGAMLVPISERAKSDCERLYAGGRFDVRYESRAIKHSIVGALSPNATINLAGVTEHAVRSALSTDHDNAVQSNEMISSYTDPRFSYANATKGSYWSRMVMQRLDTSSALASRVKNYTEIFESINDLSRAHVLFGPIGASKKAAPYVFPLLIHDPNLAHVSLRQSGIDVLRWEDFDSTGCPVAERMRHQLIQLPCHQYLSKSDITRMVTVLRKILG